MKGSEGTKEWFGPSPYENEPIKSHSILSGSFIRAIALLALVTKCVCIVSPRRRDPRRIPQQHGPSCSDHSQAR